jgi:hypothetical protein
MLGMVIFCTSPLRGGALDQGAKTMSILKYIQFLFRQKLMDDERNRNKFPKY